MTELIVAGVLVFSMATPVNWGKITTDFSHWSYHSQKEVKKLQKTEHCFVWRDQGVNKLTIPQKKAKK